MESSGPGRGGAAERSGPLVLVATWPVRPRSRHRAGTERRPASWYSELVERWCQRADADASAQKTSWLPSWAIHPECTALAVIFASPYWAKLAIPSADRRHRLFYEHLLIAVGDRGRDVPSIRNFDPLPEAIREQASWGRLLSDPEWGSPILSRQGTRKIPYIDISVEHERSVA